MYGIWLISLGDRDEQKSELRHYITKTKQRTSPRKPSSQFSWTEPVVKRP